MRATPRGLARRIRRWPIALRARHSCVPFMPGCERWAGSQLIEAVAAAGGLSGTGPVTFPNVTPWRRDVMNDLTAALSAAAQPAPTNTQFNPATTAANLAAQVVAARQPVPPRPGATQQFPPHSLGQALSAAGEPPLPAAAASPRRPAPSAVDLAGLSHSSSSSSTMGIRAGGAVPAMRNVARLCVPGSCQQRRHLPARHPASSPGGA